MRQVLMGLAGAGFLFIAFATLAGGETRSVPLTVAFVPVGIGLISGSRYMCWLGRAAVWVVILFFLYMAAGMGIGYYKAEASAAEVGLMFSVWVALCAFAEGLLRLRLKWSHPAH
jgi:hypothetical protein